MLEMPFLGINFFRILAKRASPDEGAADGFVCLDGSAPAGEIAASTANRPGSALACGGGTGGASVKRLKISE